jgi:hypothetical protein
MSNSEDEDLKDSAVFVYLPYEGVYATIVRHGAWSSLVEYYDNGIGYTIEIPNDEFVVIDDGTGYIDETGEDL